MDENKKMIKKLTKPYLKGMDADKKDRTRKQLHTNRLKPLMLRKEKSVFIKKKGKRAKPDDILKGKIVLKKLKEEAPRSYKDYDCLRKMWKSYIVEFLSLDKSKNTDKLRVEQDLMLKADLHGAEISVASSACDSMVGQHGTVIVETKLVFLIVTPQNKLVTVPKKGNIFQVRIEDLLVTIFGDQFCLRPSCRLIKRFKNYVPTLKGV